MTPDEIEKLRAAGFTDADIANYQKNAPAVPSGATVAPSGDLPEIDITKPSETLTRAREAGVPTQAPETTVWQDVKDIGMAVVPGVAENIGTIVGTGAGLGAIYGGSKMLGAYREGKRLEQETEKFRQEQLNKRAQLKAQPQVRPVAPAPSAASRVSPILDQFGRPIQAAPAPTAPVAPSPQSAAQAQNIAREQAIKNFAANKAGIPELKVPVDQVRPVAPTQAPGIGSRIMQGAGQLARGAARLAGPLGVAYSLLAPSNADTNYPWPMSGPLRGNEINPNTGMPWTREELNAYYQQYSPDQSAPPSAPSGSLFEGAMP